MRTVSSRGQRSRVLLDYAAIEQEAARAERRGGYLYASELDRAARRLMRQIEQRKAQVTTCKEEMT